MKKFYGFALTAILAASFAVSVAAQKPLSKDESFQQIAKLSNTKKPEDREKAYQMGKEFLTQFGKDADDKVKKIKAYVENYRLGEFNKAVDDVKMADALKYGKDILADEPENSYVTMNLGYCALDTLTNKQDRSFAAEGIAYSKQTIALFEAGKLPKDFKPFKDQAEVTALMYYAIGTFSVESDLKQAAQSFQKATTFESQVKSKSYPYYIIAFYYERLYEAAAADFQKKFAGKPEDAAMKAERAAIDVLIDRMIDAYARTVKLAEAENNASLGVWKERLTQIYKFRKGDDKGLAGFIGAVLSTPMPEVIQ
ncbi:MAG: hypothetical protein IPN69_11290 [Acidobacteria bacterium]|nr:hypothetical protein [Acidobacteriota bacterium]MBK8811299.1 hypothetical protein [Acidobacteriota bacterium]